MSLEQKKEKKKHKRKEKPTKMRFIFPPTQLWIRIPFLLVYDVVGLQLRFHLAINGSLHSYSSHYYSCAQLFAEKGGESLAIPVSTLRWPAKEFENSEMQVISDVLWTHEVMDTWLAYAPVKNNPEDAAKVPKGNPYHSATSGEMAIYRANSLILRKAGVQIADPMIDVFNGQEVEVWPRITWRPKWALTYADVKRKVSGGCSISWKSTMVINGKNVFLDGLSLDGTLVVNAIDEAEVKVTGHIQNNGWTLKHIDYKDSSIPEEIRIRGFKIVKAEQLEINYSEAGKFCHTS